MLLPTIRNISQYIPIAMNRLEAGAPLARRQVAKRFQPQSAEGMGLGVDSVKNVVTRSRASVLDLTWPD